MPWVERKKIAFVPVYRPRAAPNQIPPDWGNLILSRVVYDPDRCSVARTARFGLAARVVTCGWRGRQTSVGSRCLAQISGIDRIVPWCRSTEVRGRSAADGVLTTQLNVEESENSNSMAKAEKFYGDKSCPKCGSPLPLKKYKLLTEASADGVRDQCATCGTIYALGFIYGLGHEVHITALVSER
jgi:hypothetical protein